MPTKVDLLKQIDNLNILLSPHVHKQLKKELKREGKYKICTKCDEKQLITNYNISKKNTRRGECKECQKGRNANNYLARKNNIIKCSCGLEVNETNKYEHVKSAKHIKRLNLLQN